MKKGMEGSRKREMEDRKEVAKPVEGRKVGNKNE